MYAPISENSSFISADQKEHLIAKNMAWQISDTHILQPQSYTHLQKLIVSVLLFRITSFTEHFHLFQKWIDNNKAKPKLPNQNNHSPLWGKCHAWPSSCLWSLKSNLRFYLVILVLCYFPDKIVTCNNCMDICIPYRCVQWNSCKVD